MKDNEKDASEAVIEGRSRYTSWSEKVSSKSPSRKRPPLMKSH
ncbi:MAG: hypothetical protein CM15mP117_07470 [Alphaproteobacteria bacterium]|nr:MAG: hypothetical protein CM15mP117_07470 [Alphaproteobacteria bacterium]